MDDGYVDINTTYCSCDSEEIVNLGNGFGYIRISVRMVKTVSKGSNFILGYVNTNFADGYVHPGIATIGYDTSFTDDGPNLNMYFISASNNGAIRCLVTGGNLATDTKIYATFFFFSTKL